MNGLYAMRFCFLVLSVCLGLGAGLIVVSMTHGLSPYLVFDSALSTGVAGFALLIVWDLVKVLTPEEPA